MTNFILHATALEFLAVWLPCASFAFFTMLVLSRPSVVGEHDAT